MSLMYRTGEIPNLGTMFLEMEGLPLLVLLGMTLFFWGVVITLLLIVLRDKR